MRRFNWLQQAEEQKYDRIRPSSVSNTCIEKDLYTF